MTIRSWHSPEVAVVGRREIDGGFVPNGTGAIATTYGVGFTVARSAAGIYLVTLDEGFAKFLGASLTPMVESSLAHDGALSLGAVSVANKTFEIVNRVAGTKTDISASGVLRVIWFNVRVARNDIPGVLGYG